MIVLDTHIWVWWVHGDSALSASTRVLLDSSEQTGLAVSAISCWEVAKLVERGRLTLPCPVFDWLQQALAYPGVRLIELSPRICVESTQLPGEVSPRPRRPDYRRHGSHSRCASRDRGREDSGVSACQTHSNKRLTMKGTCVETSYAFCVRRGARGAGRIPR